MNFFTPGIALLQPMSGTLRFWILPAPLLLVLLFVMVLNLVGSAAGLHRKGDLVGGGEQLNDGALWGMYA